MTFQDGFQIDPNRERDGLGNSGGGARRRGGRGVAVGGGGGIIVIIIAIIMVMTGNTDAALRMLSGNQGSPVGASGGQFGDRDPASGGSKKSAFAHCTNAQAANTDVNCRVLGAMTSLDLVWEQQLPRLGKQYRKPGLDIFKGNVNTRCGRASSALGPFYCPADETAYFDTGFFRDLETKFGASGGPLAQQYVVAHEVGHHISNQIGTIGMAQRDPKGPESGAVRVELQADCFAGIWAHHAPKVKQSSSGKAAFKQLTEKDIQDALSAASAVGDDRIQQRATGRINPEGFTHGTSKQRMTWFMRGYQSGDPRICDTFNNRI